VPTDPLDLFLELCAIPSPPGEERAVCDRVLAELRALGLEVDEDDAGAEIGSTMGNVLARLPGDAEGGVPLFFCAHLDTVPPEGPIEPVVEDGVVRNAGGTILGADNKAAVVAMIEGVRRVADRGLPHPGVELLFTPKEEVGLVGAKAFDTTRLRGGLGYVYDQGAPVGGVVLGAPSQTTLYATFHGRAAHSGMHPEEGRSAIAAAAKAIADFRLGRLDDETTANVGVVSGGTARNIVPEWCSFEAEVRSHDERKLRDVVQEMLDAITFAAGLAECEVDTRLEENYRAYRFRREDLPVRLASEALTRVGVQPSYVLTGGGADANVFNQRGLACVNLANGMTAIHTPDEHIAVSDIERMAEVTVGLVEAAASTGR
jgi:tripeptide aminopeptidase